MSAVPWSADASLELQELITAPTWAILKQVPPQLYSLGGISVIASGIGEPLHTEHSRLEPFHFGDTKVKVEIKLEHLPPLAVIVKDTQGYSVRVEVEYPRLPPKCCNCGKFGHSLKYCPCPIQRKNFKLHQTGPRVSKSSSQVTVDDRDLKPEEVLPSAVVELDFEGGNQEAIISEKQTGVEVGECSGADLSPLTPRAQIPVDSSPALMREEALEEIQPAQSKPDGYEGKHHPLRASGFTPFAGKPSLRFLSHRVDKTKKLRLHKTTKEFSQDSEVVAEVVAEVVTVDPGIELEEGEIPFLPSPAAVKKAKRLKRLEAKHVNSPPSQAVSQMFSSIRDKSLGRKLQRY
ncbi:Uncharacterized protein Rs2_37805 [Raphanus sativus]|uniref:Uncharacterized protein LOC108819948 n=1 Tax=Raphanus sativus TaxID=3726 RepID=A0A6J0KLL0_RAPSA|nr:uncharacterized protein LOC108819948 [Raphanus sativus]KAJ4880750.1 Uncharacterized protein Rs2_37805 [Raphanus sativus]